MLHPSTVFFQDGRCRFKIDPQLDSSIQPQAWGLHSIWSANFCKSHFHIDQDFMGIFWRPPGLELGDAWELLGEDLKVLGDELEHIPLFR